MNAHLCDFCRDRIYSLTLNPGKCFIWDLYEMCPSCYALIAPDGGKFFKEADKIHKALSELHMAICNYRNEEKTIK